MLESSNVKIRTHSGVNTVEIKIRWYRNKGVNLLEWILAIY